MWGVYERKLGDFVAGKSFSRLAHPICDRADDWCDACGSLEPRLLFGLKEISRRGVIRKGFCRKSAGEAF